MSEWDPHEEIPIHVEEGELVERPDRTLNLTRDAEHLDRLDTDRRDMQLMEDGTVRLRRIHIDIVRPSMIDAMSREIHPGDILNWRSGGYYGHFLSFGLVMRVDYGNGHIQVLNHNKNMTTIWNTHLCVILASEGDYSMIPESYLKIWFLE